MDVSATLREGRVADALAQAKNAVRAEPARAENRLQLFELFVVTGDWKRAREQLGVAASLDPQTSTAAMFYGTVIEAEVVRAEVMSGKRTPVVLGEPDAWIAEVTEALRVLGEGQVEAAEALRARAFEAAATPAGSLDGAAFEWLIDGDSRLGPILEVILNGRYGWLPFSRLSALTVETPVHSIDLVWAKATVRFANGGESKLLIPVRYAGSEASGDPEIQLARKTTWSQRGEQTYVGEGQRTLISSGGDHPILEVRQIEFAEGG